MGNRFFLENAELPEFRICLNSPKRHANVTSQPRSVGILSSVDRTGRLTFAGGRCVHTGPGRHAHQSQFTLWQEINNLVRNVDERIYPCGKCCAEGLQLLSDFSLVFTP